MEDIKYLLNFKPKKLRFKPICEIDKEIYKIYQDLRKKEIFNLWKKNNQNKLKGYNKKYYVNNKEERIKIVLDYQKNNKNKCDEIRKRYYKNKYITCSICNKYYSAVNIGNHNKSMRHNLYLLRNIQNINY